MRIVTPADIEQVAWEGTLEPLGEAFRKDASVLPRITLGEPAWWRPQDALKTETGKEWAPPANGRRYTLIRLACTLHALGEPRASYSGATITTYLRPRTGVDKVIAHDLYPIRTTGERKGKFNVSLGPDLKFAGAASASLGEVGTEIEYLAVFPVIQGYGLGESNPYWQFFHDRTNPLIGCQHVYLVAAAPPNVDAARMTIELVVTVETRFGPFQLGFPSSARNHQTFIIPFG